MDERLDTPVFQILLQGITLLTQDGKDMVNIVGIIHPHRKGYQRITDMVIIIMGYRLAVRIVLIKMPQLDIKYGSLNTVKTTVTANVFEYILQSLQHPHHQKRRGSCPDRNYDRRHRQESLSSCPYKYSHVPGHCPLST